MYLLEWAQKHKEKYAEIRRIGNGFYCLLQIVRQITAGRTAVEALAKGHHRAIQSHISNENQKRVVSLGNNRENQEAVC